MHGWPTNFPNNQENNCSFGIKTTWKPAQKDWTQRKHTKSPRTLPRRQWHSDLMAFLPNQSVVRFSLKATAVLRLRPWVCEKKKNRERERVVSQKQRKSLIGSRALPTVMASIVPTMPSSHTGGCDIGYTHWLRNRLFLKNCLGAILLLSRKRRHYDRIFLNNKEKIIFIK